MKTSLSLMPQVICKQFCKQTITPDLDYCIEGAANISFDIFQWRHLFRKKDSTLFLNLNFRFLFSTMHPGADVDSGLHLFCRGIRMVGHSLCFVKLPPGKLLIKSYFILIKTHLNYRVFLSSFFMWSSMKRPGMRRPSSSGIR